MKDKNEERREPQEYTKAEQLYDQAIAIFRKSPREDDLEQPPLWDEPPGGRKQ